MLAELLHTLPQVLIDGLALGAVYAIVALGYTMVYGILELINFAHGEIFMSGAFIGTAILITLSGAGILAAIP
ncbi:MAG: ABC transporter permease subunit, partial [Bacilli bacterium]